MIQLISEDRYIAIVSDNPEARGVFGLTRATLVSIQVRSISGNRLIASYGLPAFRDVFGIGAHFAHQSISTQDSDEFLPLGTPFGCRSHPELVVINVYAHNNLPGSLTERVITFVTLAETFLSDPSDLDTYMGKFIPWDDWGVQNARILHGWVIMTGICSYRISSQKTLFDFNPNSIARDLHKGHTEGIVTDVSVDDIDYFHNRAIKSGLAFRKLSHQNFLMLFGNKYYPGDPLIMLQKVKGKDQIVAFNFP